MMKTWSGAETMGMEEKGGDRWDAKGMVICGQGRKMAKTTIEPLAWVTG